MVPRVTVVESFGMDVNGLAFGVLFVLELVLGSLDKFVKVSNGSGVRTKEVANRRVHTRSIASLSMWKDNGP